MKIKELILEAANFNASSEAHVKAKALTKHGKGISKAKYNSDGSATILTNGFETITSANVVDGIHKNAGLDHNRSPAEYNNLTVKNAGLTYVTTFNPTRKTHEIHIS
jgi:hypothetical protein